MTTLVAGILMVVTATAWAGREGKPQGRSTTQPSWLKYTFTPGRSALAASVQIDEVTRTTHIPELYPTSVSAIRYGTGNGRYGPGEGTGRGVLVATGGAQGIAIVDVNARAFMQGRPVPIRKFDLDNLAGRGAVKRAAQGLGMEMATLTLQVQEVKLSSPHSDDLALTFKTRLRDGRGVEQDVMFSSWLRGNPARGLADLRLGPIEAGAVHSWGWAMPPSGAKRD